MAQQRIAGRQTKPESATSGLKKDASGNYAVNTGTTTKITSNQLEINPGNTTINTDLTVNKDAVLSTELNRMKIHGFIDSNQITVSLTGTDRDTITVTPVASTFTYYWQGHECIITGSKSILLPGSPHLNGLWYIYINSNNGTLVASQTEWDIESIVPVCTVIWYQGNTVSNRSLIAYEAHTIAMSQGTHSFLHDVLGTKVTTKGSITGYTLQTATNAGTTYGVSTTSLRNQDIKYTIPALVDGNGSGANYTVFNRVGISQWKFSTGNNYPFLVGSGNSYLGRDTTAGIVDTTNGKYINTYVFFSNITNNGIALIHGQTEYSNLNDCFNEQVYSLDLSGFPIIEYVFAYKITWLINSTFTNIGKCRIERISNVNISPKDIEDYQASASVITIAPLPGYRIDSRLIWTDATTVTASAGIIEIGNLIYQNTIPQTVLFTDSEGGITKANNTWYYVYARPNPTDPGAWYPMISTTLPTRDQYGNTVLSYSNTAKYHPTLQARFIGSFRTDATGNYLKFRITGDYVQWIGLGRNLILTNGGSTTKTALNVRTVTPYTSDLAMFYVEMTANADLRYVGDVDAWYFICGGPTACGLQIPITNDSIYHQLQTAARRISIGVYGYYEIV